MLTPRFYKHWKGTETWFESLILGLQTLILILGTKRSTWQCLLSMQPSSTSSRRLLLSGQPRSWPPASRCPSPPCAGRSPSGSLRGWWWSTHHTPSAWLRRVAWRGNLAWWTCLASPTAWRTTRRTASLPIVQTRGKRGWACSGPTSWACSPTWRVSHWRGFIRC